MGLLIVKFHLRACFLTDIFLSLCRIHIQKLAISCIRLKTLILQGKTALYIHIQKWGVILAPTRGLRPRPTAPRGQAVRGTQAREHGFESRLSLFLCAKINTIFDYLCSSPRSHMVSGWAFGVGLRKSSFFNALRLKGNSGQK